MSLQAAVHHKTNHAVAGTDGKEAVLNSNTFKIAVPKSFYGLKDPPKKTC